MLENSSLATLIQILIILTLGLTSRKTVKNVSCQNKLEDIAIEQNMDTKVDMIWSLAQHMNFSCSLDENAPTGYYDLSSMMMFELNWHKSPIAENKNIVWGQTNCDWVNIHIHPCDVKTPFVFFHEVGHFMLQHCISPIDSSAREEQANQFARQILDSFYLRKDIYYETVR